MSKTKYYLSILLFFCLNASRAQVSTTTVNNFDKVIVSPHIEVTFIEGDEEKVIIESCTVSKDKINIEINSKTLRLYLDDAKEVDKYQTVYENGNKVKRAVYNGTVVVATIMYKKLEELSVRGEETMVCKSLLKGENFRLKIYGESKVYLKEVSLNKMHTTIYGESILNIKAGTINDQKFVAYGESKINGTDIQNNTTKITVYGESEFNLNVKDEIRITAYGEAEIAYHGNPVISKGINIGEVRITKLD